MGKCASASVNIPNPQASMPPPRTCEGCGAPIRIIRSGARCTRRDLVPPLVWRRLVRMIEWGVALMISSTATNIKSPKHGPGPWPILWTPGFLPLTRRVRWFLLGYENEQVQDQDPGWPRVSTLQNLCQFSYALGDPQRAGSVAVATEIEGPNSVLDLGSVMLAEDAIAIASDPASWAARNAVIDARSTATPCGLQTIATPGADLWPRLSVNMQQCRADSSVALRVAREGVAAAVLERQAELRRWACCGR